MAQPIPTTDFMAPLLRLVHEGRDVQAQAVWETLIQTQPDVAAQWYLLASLLRDTHTQQQIAEGLEKRGHEPRETFLKRVRTLETLHRLNHFLVQVRRAKSADETAKARHRSALTRLLNGVQRCKQTRPTEVKPVLVLDRLERLLANATERRRAPCPIPPP